jgi:hypothetical protein
MKTIVEFVKTTLIGGLLIVVPAYLTVLLLAKALGGIVALLGPIVALLPGDPAVRQLMAFALVVLLCFVLGVVARTGLGRRAIGAFERRVLERLPGFALLRAVARRLSGSSDDEYSLRLSGSAFPSRSREAFAFSESCLCRLCLPTLPPRAPRAIRLWQVTGAGGNPPDHGHFVPGPRTCLGGGVAREAASGEG